MLQKKIMLVAALAAMLWPGNAIATVADDPKWDGVIDILSATGASCATGGIAAGQVHSASYRLRVGTTVAAGWANTALSFSTGATGRGIVRANSTTSKLHGSQSYTGAKVHGNVDYVVGFTGTVNLALSPSSPVAANPFITLTGTITNFNGFAGCTVAIRGALSRRP